LDELEWLKYEKARAAHERDPSLHPMPRRPWQRGTHIDSLPIEDNASTQGKRLPAQETKEEGYGKPDDSHTQPPPDKRIPGAGSELSNYKMIHRAGIGLKRLHDTPAALAIIALAAPVITFFLADGFLPRVGILGSIPRMHVSLGFAEIPYRWILIVSLALLSYAAIRYVTARSQKT